MTRSGSGSVLGLLVHKVALLRTAEDVRAGEDTHPEPVWLSGVHESDGVLPELGRVSSSAAATIRGEHDHGHAHDHEHDHHHGHAHDHGDGDRSGATRTASDRG